MSPRIKIPTEELASFSSLIDTFLNVVNNTKPTYSRSSFIDEIVKNTDLKNAEKITKTLLSLYNLFIRSPFSVEEVIISLINSFKEKNSNHSYQKDDLDKLIYRLNKLINLHNSVGVVSQIQKFAYWTQMYFLILGLFLIQPQKIY